MHGARIVRVPANSSYAEEYLPPSAHKLQDPGTIRPVHAPRTLGAVRRREDVKCNAEALTLTPKRDRAMDAE